jgi:hypothetical protein
VPGRHHVPVATDQTTVAAVGASLNEFHRSNTNATFRPIE